MEEIYLKEQELAERLHCSRSKLAKDRFKRRGLPYVKHGRHILYYWPDVKAALAAQSVDPTGGVRGARS